MYNLHRAKGDVTKAGRAFVVEGYTDIIALHQAGIRTAVATSGTALGEGHFRLLARFARQAVLCFDADEAGARAAERAHSLFERFGIEVAVLILPAGRDPADFVTEEGAEAFERLAEQATPLVEYMLERGIRDIDLDSPEGKARAVRETLPVVSGLQDPVLRSQYAGRLADLVGISPTDVALELEQAGQPLEGGASPKAGETRARSPERELEMEALKIVVQVPEVGQKVVDRIGDDLFTGERRKAWTLIRESTGPASAVAGPAAEETTARLIALLAVEPLRGEPTQEYADKVFAKLQERALREEVRTMRKRLEALNPVKDASTFDPLFRELADLTGRWREAKARAGEGA